MITRPSTVAEVPRSSSFTRKSLHQQSVKAPEGHFRPEAELLLCCARTCVDSERAERIKALLLEGIDWEYLIRTAQFHGVMPLLYRSLNTICPEAVPRVALDLLRDFFYANTSRNLFLTGELLKLLHLLKAHGIPAIPFKGPALAASVYGNLALRQFGDLDIFVPKRDLPRASAVLLSQGYQAKDQLNHGQRGDPLQAKYHSFYRQDGLVKVDLQWMIAGSGFSFQLDHEDWRAQLAPISLSGTSILGFPPEVTLLILCVHGSKHLWAKLQLVCDVAELLRSYPQIDWERVKGYARPLGCQRMLALGVLFAHDLLGTTLPAKVLKRIQQDVVAQSLVEQLQPQLFLKNDDSSCTVDPSAFYLKMKERWGDRARYVFYLCVQRSPIITRRTSQSLPAIFTFLYYLLWPFLLIGKYGFRSQKLKKAFSQWLEHTG